MRQQLTGGAGSANAGGGDGEAMPGPFEFAYEKLHRRGVITVPADELAAGSFIPQAIFAPLQVTKLRRYEVTGGLYPAGDLAG